MKRMKKNLNRLLEKKMTEDKRIIFVTNIKREKGYLYPTSSDDKGNIVILKIKAGRKK